MQGSGERVRRFDPEQYMPGLDGLRAIAVGCVLLAHGFEQFGGLDSLHPYERLISAVCGRLGTAGVKLFFAISGYLICTRFAGELMRWERGAALRAFYVRRVFRIIPPLLPYLLVLTVGLYFGALAKGPSEIFAALFFYSNYFSDKSWFTTHFWSLSVEEHFYLIWAPLLAFAGRRWAGWVAVAVVIVTYFLRPVLTAPLTVQERVDALEKTHLQLDSFMLPCLLALALFHPRVRQVAFRFTKTAWLAVLVAGLAFTGALPQTGLKLLDTQSFQALLFAGIVILPPLRPDWSVTKALESRPLVWIGRRSYAIYVWQNLFLVPFDAPMIHKVVPFLWHSAVVIAIAGISYKLLEKPCMATGRRLAGRITAASAAKAALPNQVA